MSESDTVTVMEKKIPRQSVFPLNGKIEEQGVNASGKQWAQSVSFSIADVKTPVESGKLALRGKYLIHMKEIYLSEYAAKKEIDKCYVEVHVGKDKYSLPMSPSEYFRVDPGTPTDPGLMTVLLNTGDDTEVCIYEYHWYHSYSHISLHDEASALNVLPVIDLHARPDQGKRELLKTGTDDLPAINEAETPAPGRPPSGPKYGHTAYSDLQEESTVGSDKEEDFESQEDSRANRNSIRISHLDSRRQGGSTGDSEHKKEQASEESNPEPADLESAALAN